MDYLLSSDDDLPDLIKQVDMRPTEPPKVERELKLDEYLWEIFEDSVDGSHQSVYLAPGHRRETGTTRRSGIRRKTVH